MLKAALRYAADGWLIFPLRSRGETKAPHEMLGKKGGYHLASADPSQIEAWWDRDPEANIGLALDTNGLIVVDADPSYNGIAKLAELETAFGALDTKILQDSGSGQGFHKVYLAPDGLRSAPKWVRGDKANMGVDIKFNGYIVVAPSVHPKTGERYRWRDGMCILGQRARLEVLPDWVLARSTTPGTALTASDDWTNAAMQRPVDDLDAAEIERIVLQIPPREDYHSWLEMGQALHHQFDGGVDGFELWDKHSAKALNYDAGELQAKWNSFGKDGTRSNITFRTLMQAAQEETDRRIQSDTEDVMQRLRMAQTEDEVTKLIDRQIKTLDMTPILRAKVETLVRETIKRITGTTISLQSLRRMTRYEDQEAIEMPGWLLPWVWIANTNTFFQLDTKQRLGVDSFNNMHDRRLLTRQDRLEGRANPETHAAAVALNGFQIPTVHEAIYLPGQPETFDFEGLPHVNLFNPASLPEMPDRLTAEHRVLITRLHTHIEHLIEDPQDRATFLAWLAYPVRTLRRVSWSVVLQGCEGDGKTFFFALMGAMLGARNVTTITPHVLESGFNDWAHGAIFACIEEIKLHGKNRHDVMNTLKPVITNAAIEIHPKGMKRFNAPNTQSYLLTTNYADAMPLDEGTSRYFPIMSRWQRREDLVAWMNHNPTYYDELYELVQHGGALRKYFLEEFEMPAGFNPANRAPKSASMGYMAEISKTTDRQVLDEVLTDKLCSTISSGLLDVTDFTLAWRSICDELPPYGRAMSRLLTDAGFTMLGRFRGGADNQPRRYWSRTPHHFMVNGKADTRRVALWAEEV